jgi:hypothetical protein
VLHNSHRCLIVSALVSIQNARRGGFIRHVLASKGDVSKAPKRDPSMVMVMGYPTIQHTV